MAERYLQECRRAPVTRTPSYHPTDSITDEEFERKISQLLIDVVPGMKNDYLNDYKETGILFLNLIQGIRAIPPERREVIVSKITTVVNNTFGKSSIVAMNTSRALTRAQVIAGKIVPVVIVAVQLSYEALKSIRSWWNGEISGKRCVKQIIDASAGILGGFGGGAAGCTIGTAILPGVGTIIGAVVGGIAGSAIASTFSESLTEYFFDLPKSVALEKAYGFLGLTPSSSNGEINTRYRRLALEYHPDKDGNVEDFYKLQIAVAIIKQARGEGV